MSKQNFDRLSWFFKKQSDCPRFVEIFLRTCGGFIVVPILFMLRHISVLIKMKFSFANVYLVLIARVNLGILLLTSEVIVFKTHLPFNKTNCYRPKRKGEEIMNILICTNINSKP